MQYTDWNQDDVIADLLNASSGRENSGQTDLLLAEVVAPPLQTLAGPMLEKRSAWSRICACLAKAIETYGQAAYFSFAPFEGLAESLNNRNEVSKVPFPPIQRFEWPRLRRNANPPGNNQYGTRDVE